MASKWREVQLGYVTNVITGYPFKSRHYTSDKSAPRLIGGDNIAQGHLRWDNVRRWPRDMTDGLDGFWLQPGDVVLAMDRPWIEAGLKRASVGIQDTPSLLVQRTARLRGTDTLDTLFLRYVVGSDAFTQYVLSVQTGTAVPHISPTQIRAFRFLLPPLEEQRAIAGTLGSLDDRIDNLRQTNATLEAIAQALFKSWFVDFDPVRAKAEGREPEGMDAATAALFPSEFEDSECGPIPKGWRPGRFGDVLTESTSRVKQQSATVMSAVQSGELVRSEHHFNKRVHSEDISKYKLVSPLAFAYNPSRINIGSIGLNEFGTAGAVSPIYVVAEPQDDAFAYFVWHLLRTASVRAQIVSLCSGSVRQALTSKDFFSIRMAIPSSGVVTAFRDLRCALFGSIENNAQVVANLVDLRDTLLPRLISGKLRLPEAERVVEAALA